MTYEVGQPKKRCGVVATQRTIDVNVRRLGTVTLYSGLTRLD